MDPEALRLLTAEAMHDIAHSLRPAHLQQLRKIIDDPEASGNDRFVALDLLKNVNISAGGVLPMCQDTGTAIVMGKKSEGVLSGADDAEWISKGGQAALRGGRGGGPLGDGLPCFEENPAPDAPFVPFLAECEAQVLHDAAFAEGSGGLVGLLIGGGLTHPRL